MNIAIVGATGLVGSTFLKVIERENIVFDQLYLYASKRSAGSMISFLGKEYEVLLLEESNIQDKTIDYALFSAGGSVSLEYAPVFAKYGATVIDNSSAWRMNEEIPLVVPEINLDVVKNQKIIANPNCSTIQSVLPLYALSKAYNIKSVHYATYQSVSGSGQKGIEDLERTSNGENPENYPYPIYNNVLPHIDVFMENGYTKEEYKMIFETKKILNNQTIDVTATCVRVPVVNSHSVDLYIELEEDVDVLKVRELLENQEGIKVVDDISNTVYPYPTLAADQNDVLVGRIRKDFNKPNKLHLFCVADNILKGAALNAVQIMIGLMKRSEV